MMMYMYILQEYVNCIYIYPQQKHRTDMIFARLSCFQNMMVYDGIYLYTIHVIIATR
jgi:hypothetical protein